MKIKGNIMLRAALILLVTVMTVIPMSSCSTNHGIEFDGKVYIDQTTKIEYKLAPFYLEAMGKGEEYAVWKFKPDNASWNTPSLDTILYKVAYKNSAGEVIVLDPEKWLCAETGEIFCAKNIELPTLESFGTEKISISRGDAVEFELEAITDKEEVAKFLDLWKNGNVVDYDTTVGVIGRYDENGQPTNGEYVKSPEIVVTIRFSSSDYEGIYYKLTYCQYDTGYGVLYDRDTRRCVEASELMNDYVKDYMS